MLIFHKRIFRVNINLSIEFLFLDVVDPMNQPAVLTKLSTDIKRFDDIQK